MLKLRSAVGSDLRAASRQQRGRLQKPRGLGALPVGSREWLGVEESKDRAGEGRRESQSCLSSERPCLAQPQAVLQGGRSVCCCLRAVCKSSFLGAFLPVNFVRCYHKRSGLAITPPEAPWSAALIFLRFKTRKLERWRSSELAAERELPRPRSDFQKLPSFRHLCAQCHSSERAARRALGPCSPCLGGVCTLTPPQLKGAWTQGSKTLR